MELFFFLASNYYKNLARAQSGQVITYANPDSEKFPNKDLPTITDDYNGKYRAAIFNEG